MDKACGEAGKNCESLGEDSKVREMEARVKIAKLGIKMPKKK